MRLPIKDYPVASTPESSDVVKSDEVAEYIKEIYATCLQRKAELLDRCSENQRCPSPLPQSFQAPVFNVVPPPVACSSHGVPISEWGLKFNGDVRHLYSFLERVSLLAQSRDVKNEDII